MKGAYIQLQISWLKKIKGIIVQYITNSKYFSIQQLQSQNSTDLIIQYLNPNLNLLIMEQ